MPSPDNHQVATLERFDHEAAALLAADLAPAAPGTLAQLQQRCGRHRLRERHLVALGWAVIRVVCDGLNTYTLWIPPTATALEVREGARKLSVTRL